MTRAKKPAAEAPAAEFTPEENLVVENYEEGVKEALAPEDPLHKSSTIEQPSRPPAEKVASNAILFCHQCGRTGDEDLGQCPNLQVPGGGCPTPVYPDADKDIVLHSAELGVIRTVPVAAIVRGKVSRYIPGFVREDQWKVLHPKFED